MTPTRRRQESPPILLTRTEVMAGIAGQADQFGTLVGELGEPEWSTPTRCDGWAVRDVASHITGLFADVAVGRMAGQGLPEVTARQAAQRRDLPPAKVARDLRKAASVCDRVLATFDDDAWTARAPGGFPGSLRRAVLVLWYELYLHGDDILDALGRPPERGPGLRASVAHVAETVGLWGWGPATLQLDGLEKMPVRGGGPPVTGDPHTFLLAATGRTDPSRLELDERVNIYRKVEQ